MKQIKFTVNGKPLSQNMVYRRRGSWGMYMTSKGKEFKSLLSMGAIQAMEDVAAKWFWSPSVTLKIFYDNKRANDIDGSIKLILDSMNKVVWEDDKLIKELHVNKEFDKNHPRIEITVEEYKSKLSNL